MSTFLFPAPAPGMTTETPAPGGVIAYETVRRDDDQNEWSDSNVSSVFTFDPVTGQGHQVMEDDWDHRYLVHRFIGEHLWVVERDVYGHLYQPMTVDGIVVDGAFKASYDYVLSPDGSRWVASGAGWFETSARYRNAFIIGSQAIEKFSRMYIHPLHHAGIAFAWSRDARRIGFIEYVDDKGDAGDERNLLVATGAEGGRGRTLARFPAKAIDHLDWSPNDNHILVGRSSPRSEGPMWKVASDGSSRTKLDVTGTNPVWAPDGTRIAFLREDQIWTSLPDGTAAHPLPGWTFPDYVAYGEKWLEGLAWQDACTITGTDDDDVLRGTVGRDVFCARDGDDKIVALDGNDVVYGGEGLDEIYGGPGADLLNGEREGDLVLGGPGRDVIADDRGADVFLGGDGDDHLYGLDTDDDDSFRGGQGTDRCWVDTRNDARCEKFNYIKPVDPTPPGRDR